MATVIFIRESKQTPSAMRGCISYCVQEKKTVDENGRQYVGGVNCLGTHAYEEFMATKNLYGKACGTYFYQYVQSFLPGEIQSYEEAHRIGLEFAGKSFPGYEVLVATHLDAHDDSGVQRVHNHFLVNSVSFKDGKKIHFTPNTLQELRKISDDICRDHGLSVLPPSERRNGQGIGTREYRATMRGEGWKFGLINDIETAMTQAGDRREFCDILASVGYSVTWTEERKYITFTCPNGRKVRDNKLHDNKYTKENLEYEFRIRKQITEHAGSQFNGQTESGIQNGSQDNRGNTVSADCLCDSEGGLERLSGMDETGSDLSTHVVSADSGADNQGRNASVHGRDMERNPELGGGCDRKRAENGGKHCTESADAVESEQGAARTGWEDARAVYLRSRLEGNQSYQRIQGSAYGYEAVDCHDDGVNRHRFGSFVRGDLSLDEITAFFKNERQESNLSDDDIDKAVKEAAEFEAQDKKRKEGIDTRNEADSMVFQTEKALNEVGDKVDASEKEKVQAEIDKVKAILERTQPESMTDADIEELKAAKESLMTNSQQVFAKMYEQAQQAAGGAQGAAGPDMGAAGQQTADNGGDDVVDGDFREL